MPLPYRDRADAGRQLAAKLQHYRAKPGVMVLALPRGGVPVGYQVAHALQLRLDVLMVRKLGVPGHEELAMGAIGDGGVTVLNRDIVESLRIRPQAIKTAAEKERRELARREREYRGGRPKPEIHGQTVILVDDGLATGSTMLAAVEFLRRADAKRIVVAVPVGADRTCAQIAATVEEMICLQTPEDFEAVGEWYLDFSQTTDNEVRRLLALAEQERRIAA